MDITENLPTTEVISDGKTVWVNGARGECLGRFSRWGVDVHRSIDAQLSGEGQCLACTHTKPTTMEWDRFVGDMAGIYGVTVKAEDKPTWLEQ